MSLIQEKPYIQTLLASLTSAQKSALLALIDGGEATPAFRSLTNQAAFITDADEGVSYVSLETKAGVFTGYLVLTDDYCAMACYEPGQQTLSFIEINLSDMTFKPIRQHLTILELRFELEESKEEADVISALKDVPDGIVADVIGLNASGDPVNQTFPNNAAPEYDATATYALGDLCVHDNLLYSCSTAIETAEDWTAAHWTRATLAEAVLGMINQGV